MSEGEREKVALIISKLSQAVESAWMRREETIALMRDALKVADELGLRRS